MHDELGALMDRLREDAGRLSAELRSLERDVGEVAAIGEPEEESAVAEAAPVAAPQDLEPAAPEPVAPTPEAGPVPTPDDAPAADARPEDEEAARIVALDMALGGTPREETERYLAEHYALTDPGALLDDVYALAGS
jgi:hypothetical protein